MTITTNVPEQEVGERSKIRAVALPSEHGGWSLTLEPALLGLIVGWSWHGLAIGCAGMLGFLVRTPMKIVMVDMRRKRWFDRTSLALRVTLFELTLLVGLVGLGTIGANQKLWIPLLLALPLFAIELYFDMRSKSRRLLPELCGTIGIGALAASIALAGGTDMKLSLGLWAVVAARALAAIVYVRTQVFRRRNKSPKILHSDIAQVVALLGIVVAFYSGLTVFACVLIILFLGIFNIVALRRPAPPAKFVGIQQMVFGFIVIIGTAIAVLN